LTSKVTSIKTGSRASHQYDRTPADAEQSMEGAERQRAKYQETNRGKMAATHNPAPTYRSRKMPMGLATFPRRCIAT